MNRYYTYHVDDFTDTPPKANKPRCVLKFTTYVDKDTSRLIWNALRREYPIPKFAITMIESNCPPPEPATVEEMEKIGNLTYLNPRLISNQSRAYVSDGKFVFSHNMPHGEQGSLIMTLPRPVALALQLALGEYLAANPPKE